MKTLTLTILQFNTFVKNILDAEEFLSNVSVVGEVTNFKMSGPCAGGQTPFALTWQAN